MAPTGLFETPKGISPALFRGVVSGASAAYTIKRRIPTVDEIAAHCNHQPKNISKVIATKEFKELMPLRGFPFESAGVLP